MNVLYFYGIFDFAFSKDFAYVGKFMYRMSSKSADKVTYIPWLNNLFIAHPFWDNEFMIYDIYL